MKSISLFGVLWLVALLACAGLCRVIGFLHLYGQHTQAQLACAIALCGVVATWLTVEAYSYAQKGNGSNSYAVVEMDAKPAGPSPQTVGQQGADDPEGVPDETSPIASAVGTQAAMAEVALSSLQPLRSATEFAVILGFMYVCDRTAVFGQIGKVYDPQVFWGLWALLCVVALCSVRTIRESKPLSREQTDEWKGWMQIMFLMYHYFAEHEIYNAIRIYIACYVFMTGYGNLFLYRRGKSFTVRRTLQMLFRLNFLGFFVCVILNNEYMLYYICPMHTLFTIFVLVAMYLFNQHNGSTRVLYAKIAVTAVFTILLYDGPDFLFRGTFGMLPGVRQLFAFHDPLHPEFTDEMHEWHFRSGLDRFVWIIGMVFALHVPDFEKLFEWLQSLPQPKRATTQAGIAAGALSVGFVWCYFVFFLEKRAYNRAHPFTSAVPIAIYLLLRNLTECLRKRYLWLFAYMGRVTLETYILQFHVWMKTTGINGSPKHLLELVPGSYWANFVLLTAVYVFISVRLSHLTMVLRDALIPEDLGTVGKIWAGLTAVGAICWVLALTLSSSPP
ncbi:unnamed protein product [Polarella glacialis]|uniref:Cas1p 10 TM acyl transferase domain-containing protein n=1 Tax=Polarella glacialis TaxID=89957 RepID=A0A813LC75_POLGL|nr:unnamed protein product [Polarella glacialis]